VLTHRCGDHNGLLFIDRRAERRGPSTGRRWAASIRIHQQSGPPVVAELFDNDEGTACAKFGFRLHACELGAPSMDGVALGLDRLDRRRCGRPASPW
jgi:hypothetical protein